MKTTVEIADPLLRSAKRYAAKHGLTLRDVLETGLRRVLAEPARSPGPFKLKRVPFQGTGLQCDKGWEAVRKKIYAGRGA